MLCQECKKYVSITSLDFILCFVKHALLKPVHLQTLQLQWKQHFPLKNFSQYKYAIRSAFVITPAFFYWPSILGFQYLRFPSILRFIKELSQWCHKLLNQHSSNWKGSDCILTASWNKSTCLHIRSYQLLKSHYVCVSGPRTWLWVMSYYLFPLMYCQHKWSCLGRL